MLYKYCLSNWEIKQEGDSKTNSETQQNLSLASVPIVIFFLNTFVQMLSFSVKNPIKTRIKRFHIIKYLEWEDHMNCERMHR